MAFKACSQLAMILALTLQTLASTSAEAARGALSDTDELAAEKQRATPKSSDCDGDRRIRTQGMCCDSKTGKVRYGLSMPATGIKGRPSPFAGLCTSDHSRAMETISEDADSIVLKNVTHEGVHGIAVVPKTSARAMIFQVERLVSVAAHTQVRLQFEPNSIRWYKTDGDYRAGRIAARLSDLIQSIELTWPNGASGYEANKLTKEVYPLVFVTTSLQERGQKIVFEYQHLVEQWLLKATPENIVKFISLFGKNSSAHSNKTTYKLIRRNCTNTLLKLIAEALEMQGEQVASLMFNVARSNQLVNAKLTAAGLAQGLLPTLNSELDPAGVYRPKPGLSGF